MCSPSVRGFAKGRTVAVFGCGGDRDRTKRPKMGACAARSGGLLRGHLRQPPHRGPGGHHRRDPAGHGGSRRRPMWWWRTGWRPSTGPWTTPGQDDVIVLCGKGHETYQEIDHVKHHLDEREVVAALPGRRRIQSGFPGRRAVITKECVPPQRRPVWRGRKSWKCMTGLCAQLCGDSASWGSFLVPFAAPAEGGAEHPGGRSHLAYVQGRGRLPWAD